MSTALQVKRRRRVLAAAAFFVLLAGPAAAPVPVSVSEPVRVERAAEGGESKRQEGSRLAPLARPEREIRKAKPKAKPAAVKQKPRTASLLVAPSEFRVREVRVEDEAARATIRGTVWHERKGVIAQPLLRYELRDRDGAVVRTGEFTPSDASSPLWIGYGYDGLKAVPFSLDLDLRRATPGRVPRAPFSAKVTAIAVVDAKAR